jgi:hypothetical protein
MAFWDKIKAMFGGSSSGTKPAGGDQVRLVRKYNQPGRGGTVNRYECYKCRLAETARQFLLQKTVTKPQYYIVCDTEEGSWGMDKEGLYLERLLPWQTDVDTFDVVGALSGEMGSQFALEMAARGHNDNFVHGVICGKCEQKWYDGVRYQNTTVCRCPHCGAKNLVDSENYQVYFVSNG